MAKKRKTRQEKIILQLKRELTKEKQKMVSPSMKFEARQEAISIKPKFKPQRQAGEKKTDVSIQTFNPRLIRKDLAKTAILALIALGLEFMLYLKLR